jgi:hypothetical protein
MDRRPLLVCTARTIRPKIEPPNTQPQTATTTTRKTTATQISPWFHESQVPRTDRPGFAGSTWMGTEAPIGCRARASCSVKGPESRGVSASLWYRCAPILYVQLIRTQPGWMSSPRTKRDSTTRPFARGHPLENRTLFVLRHAWACASPVCPAASRSPVSSMRSVGRTPCSERRYVTRSLRPRWSRIRPGTSSASSKPRPQAGTVWIESQPSSAVPSSSSPVTHASVSPKPMAVSSVR